MTAHSSSKLQTRDTSWLISFRGNPDENPHSRFRAGSENGTFGQGVIKNIIHTRMYTIFHVNKTTGYDYIKTPVSMYIMTSV